MLKVQAENLRKDRKMRAEEKPKAGYNADTNGTYLYSGNFIVLFRSGSSNIMEMFGKIKSLCSSLVN